MKSHTMLQIVKWFASWTAAAKYACRRTQTHTNNRDISCVHSSRRKKSKSACFKTLGSSGWSPNHSQTLTGQAAVPFEILAKHFVKRSQFHNKGQQFCIIVYNLYRVIHWSTLCVYLLRHIVFDIPTRTPQVITFRNLPQNLLYFLHKCEPLFGW